MGQDQEVHQPSTAWLVIPVHLDGVACSWLLMSDAASGVKQAVAVLLDESITFVDASGTGLSHNEFI